MTPVTREGGGAAYMKTPAAGNGEGLAFDWIFYHIGLAFKTLHAGEAPGFGESLRES